MELVVLTPEKEIFKGDIKSVKVPGKKGQFEILNGHAPIVSSLTEGVVRIIKKSGEQQEITIHRGFVEVLKNEVSILVTVPKEG